MKGLKLFGIQAGYVAWDPCERVPELKHAGEEWAFPEYVVEPHDHAFYEFHLQLTGVTEWEIEGERCKVERGGMIGVAPRRRHSMRPLQNHAHHFIYCAIDLPIALQRYSILPLPLAIMQRPYFLIPHAECFEGPFKTLSQEVAQLRPFRDDVIDQCVGMIIALLARSLSEQPQEERREYKAQIETSVLARVKGYIDLHVAEKLSIEDLVDFAGISRTTLFDVMKRELGMSPGAYHALRRIDLAKVMLQTSAHLPLTNIALDLGYSSSQHFSAAFRKLTGISPSQYREQL